MRIVELTNVQFDEYAKYNPLTNYCQTSKYALLMTNYGYTYDYIGYIDDSNTIKAAALILKKRLQGKNKYGYSPKGFLINYYDKELVKNFLLDLRKYYKRENIVFIKFNPEIIIGETDKTKDYSISYNGNVNIIDELKSQNTKRRLEAKEFELLEPKMSAYINLKNYSVNNIDRTFRKKIRKSSRKGLSIQIGTPRDIDILFNMIKKKSKKSINYYRDFYNTFSKDNSVDLLLLQVDLREYQQETYNIYTKEKDNNERINQIFFQNQSKNYQQKVNSDKRLEAYKSECSIAAELAKKQDKDIIAAALIVKHYNRITVIVSGYKDEYKKLYPNTYMYHAIFERYKEYFDFCDLNGVTGDFSQKSEYVGLNQSKLKFNPKVYEFIGEFDLICNDHTFNKLIKTSFIEDELIK